MEQSTTPDFIVKAETVRFEPFSIPGFSGGTAAALLNGEIDRAPYVVLLKMEPGAKLAKHYHPSIAEAVYVVEGELINNGELLTAGGFMAHGPGVVHGPHETETGCTLMFIQAAPVGPDDSVFVD
jgi:anti-sigma factor ChrR (cupin superfamily)